MAFVRKQRHASASGGSPTAPPWVAFAPASSAPRRASGLPSRWPRFDVPLLEWVTFDGGYDVGYLLKILTGCRLPDMQEGFFELVSTFFPTVYDVKHLMAFRDGLHGGLNEVAELLGVEQVEACRQAGSDGLLTARVFREMKERYFDGSVETYDP